MRKLTKKISMLMVLAMLVGLFSGVVSASAASKWSFKSAKYDVAVGSEINMKKNEYADFDLLKEGKALAGYTVTWESSDEDVVWVNAKSGQLRADKAKKAEDGDKAVITANIVNDTTKKTHKVSFTIVVGEYKAPVYTVELADVTAKLGEEIKFAPVVKNEAGEVVKFAEHKSYNGYFLDGEAITNPWTPEELGEYTITVAQFASKADKADLSKAVRKDEAKVTVIYDGILSAKQISYNTVAITCGSEAVAKAIADDASKIAVAYVLNDNEIKAYVKAAKVDEKNAAVVNVELYNTLQKDTAYKFTFGADSVSVTGTDLTKYNSIKILTDKVAANGQPQKVTIAVYNEAGIVVAHKEDGFYLVRESDNVDYYVEGAKIGFHNAWKSAVVTAVLDMGYDDNGIEIADLKDTREIASIDENATTASQINGWWLSTAGANPATADAKGWFGTGNFNLAVGEAQQLFFRYETKKNTDGTITKIFDNALTAANSEANAAYLYASSVDGVIMVTDTGYITPVAAGKAQVIVYKYMYGDQSNKQVIGVCNFNVADQRLLTSSAPSVNKSGLSTDGGDEVKIYVNTKDQFGAAFGGSDTFSIELGAAIDPAVALQVKKADDSFVTITVDNNGTGISGLKLSNDSDGKGNYITVKALTAKDTVSTVTLVVTATQGYPYKQISRSVVVQPKDAKAAGSYGNYYAFSDPNVTVDMKLYDTPDYWTGLANYNKDISLFEYDSQNYLVGEKTMYANRADASTGDVYYVVMKNGTNFATNTKVVATDTFMPMSVTNGVQAVKIDKGTYSVTAYVVKDMGNAVRDLSVATKIINVTDSTSAVAVVQKDNKLTTAQVASLEAAMAEKLGLSREGKPVTLTINSVDATVAAANKKVYVTKINVTETYAGLGGKTYTWDIAVGKVFDIVD